MEIYENLCVKRNFRIYELCHCHRDNKSDCCSSRERKRAADLFISNLVVACSWFFILLRQRPLPEGWKRAINHRKNCTFNKPIDDEWITIGNRNQCRVFWPDFHEFKRLFCIGSSDSVLHTELGFRVDLANNSRSVAHRLPIHLYHMHCRTDLIAFSHSKEFVRCFHDSITASACEKEISFDSATFSSFSNETRKIFLLLRVVIEFEKMKNWLLVSEGD